MTETSRFWDGTTVGDAATAAPYDAGSEFAKVMMSISGTDADTNKGGVFLSDLSELAPTNPSSTTVRIASGRAIVWGSWYENDSNVDTTPAAPAASTRIDRYVLRKDWAAQTIRVTRIAGVEGGGAPALTQNAGTTWDYPLCQASTTTGGVVTITDERTFAGGSITTSYVPGAATYTAGTAGTWAEPALEATDTVIPTETRKFDAASDEKVTFTLDVPDSYNGSSIPIKVKWFANATSGAARWALRVTPVADGEAMNTATTEVAVDNFTTFGTANRQNIDTLTWSSNLPSPGDTLFCEFVRDADNGGDTLAVDAELISLLFKWGS